MTQEMLIMAAILVAVILLTFIGILSRYRKCKSDEVLVVYGKTGGDKKSAKLNHGCLLNTSPSPRDTSSDIVFRLLH